MPIYHPRTYIKPDLAYNPMDNQFGAVGDGSTDDTVAVQACATLAQANGRHMLITNKHVVSSINIPGSRFSVSMSPGAELIHKAGSTLPIFFRAQNLALITDLLFEDLVLTGFGDNNGLSETKTGIFVFYSERVRVEGCKIYNFARGGIKLATNKDSWILNNRVSGCAVIAAGDNAIAVDQDPVNTQSSKVGNYFILGNEVTGMQAGGIIIQGASAVDEVIRMRAVISDNVVRDSSGFCGIGFEGGYCEAIQVSNNQIQNCLTGIALNTPVWPGPGGSVPGARNIVCEGNVIDGDSRVGATGINNTASNAVIRGNTIRTRGTCINVGTVGAGAEPRYCVISDNVLQLENQAATQPAALTLNPIYDSVVHDNVLIWAGSGAGDMAAGLLSTRACKRVLIHHNYIRNAKRGGIYAELDAADRVTFKDNVVIDCNAGNHNSYAIRLLSAGTKYKLIGNELIDTGTANPGNGIYISGTVQDVVMENNLLEGSFGVTIAKDGGATITRDRGNRKSLSQKPNGSTTTIQAVGNPTVLNIPHGLFAQPNAYSVVPYEAVAAGIMAAPGYFVTSDTTNLIVTIAAGNWGNGPFYTFAWTAWV